MKRKFVQIAALCLAAVLLLTTGGGTASASSAGSDSRIIRVGLHYGTGAMEGLNLENKTGSGFRFGYYDGSNQFVELGSTSEKAVSVVKTMNVYYGTYDGYTSYHSALKSSSVAVGEYHLQLPGTYSTYEEAQSAVADYTGGFPAYIDGKFYARVGSYTTKSQAEEALSAMGTGCKVGETSGYGVSVVITGTNTIVFQFDDLGKGTGLGVEPNRLGAGDYTTLSKNVLYPGGFRFERIGGGFSSMTVVNMVEFGEYIEGVVATEMSNSWPVEALKAQAVAARSYAVTLGSKHSAHHFDICDSTDCQAYTGQSRAGSNTRAAVEGTAGQMCLYNGKVAQTFYYSSNGGASESVSNVWGSNQANYPYLVGKADPYESTLNLNNTWERTVTSDQIISRLLFGSNVTAPIVSAEVTSYTEAGNPKLITFTDSAGKRFPVSSATIYSYNKGFGLPSFRFGFAGPDQSAAASSSDSVSVNGSATVNGTSGLYAIDGNGNISALGSDVYIITSSGTSQLGQGGGQSAGNDWSSSVTAVNGSITFAGRGWGHNIGMSQWGAYAMAQQNYTYTQILQFYYTGITVGFM